MKSLNSLMRFPFYSGIAAMILLSSCATFQPQPHPAVLPGDVPMNHDAGRGSVLIVRVQLEDGEELPFMVDTGSPITCFDKSLEPKLGKSRGTGRVMMLDGSKMDVTIHKAPKLYLQDVRLMTGDIVIAIDLRKYSSEAGHPIMGIIGMDILKHYCIQLDFRANKIRFVEGWFLWRDGQFWGPNTSGWGKAFSLQNRGDAVYINDDLAGTFLSPGSVIDTGCFYDGWLESKTYRRWADNSKPPKKGHAKYPNAILGGEIYTNVVLSETALNLPLVRIPFVPFALVTEYNGVGLHFLARNLVTLDFPLDTMYLKQTTVGPLEDEESKAVVNAEEKLASGFLRDLKENGKLPGWSKDEKWPIRDLTFHYYFPETFSFSLDGIQKAGDPTTYHYVVFRSDKGAPWQLIDAWQTDAHGKTIKEYLITAKKPAKK